MSLSLIFQIWNVVVQQCVRLMKLNWILKFPCLKVPSWDRPPIWSHLVLSSAGWCREPGCSCTLSLARWRSLLVWAAVSLKLLCLSSDPHSASPHPWNKCMWWIDCSDERHQLLQQDIHVIKVKGNKNGPEFALIHPHGLQLMLLGSTFFRLSLTLHWSLLPTLQNSNTRVKHKDNSHRETFNHLPQLCKVKFLS